jgi:hypothetical protein
MADCMSFPQTWEQFLHDYEFEDGRRIYTNGAKLMPSFRVKQMMEHYLLEAKSEAIREFAKEFVADLSHMVTYDKDYIKAKIFNLVERKQKEMVGESDE